MQATNYLIEFKNKNIQNSSVNHIIDIHLKMFNIWSGKQEKSRYTRSTRRPPGKACTAPGGNRGIFSSLNSVKNFREPDTLVNSSSRGSSSSIGNPSSNITSITVFDRAKNLGYGQRIPPQKASFNSHGQPVFYNGKNYITPDIDGHNTLNGWKMYNKKNQRSGTWNSDLSVRIKN